MIEPSHRRGKVVDDNILDSVIAAIEEAGTLSVKVDRVAELAGVNKTTIYRRFPKREDLVLAAVLAHADMSIPIPDTGALRSDLLAIAKTVRDTVTSPLGVALLSASSHIAPELVELRPAFWSMRFTAAAEVLHRAFARGEYPLVENPDELIELMVAPIHFRASQVGNAITDNFLELQVERVLSALSSY
jgi:AcrR family transcriptional regulator